MIAADGTGLQLVAPHSLFAAWSPDGTRIVWKVEGAEAGLRAVTDHQP